MRGCQLAFEVPGEYEGTQALYSWEGGKFPDLEAGDLDLSPSVGAL